MTHPAPFEGDYDDGERDRAITALGAHWAEPRFEYLKSGLRVLDLSAMTFQERMGELTRPLHEEVHLH